jgi:ABC-type branched-subunit amino acid transport system ATPase component
LDEPVAGMNPIESENIVKLLRKLNDSGLTIILVEHSMNVIMNITSHIIVLDSGRIIAEGKPESICKDSKVIEAYLGKKGGIERARNKRS